MAKKKQNKAKKAAKVVKVDAQDKALTPKASQMLEEYDRGSFAGVRFLAERALSDVPESGAGKAFIDTLLGRTQIDPVQLAVGVAASLLALSVGALTLT